MKRRLLDLLMCPDCSGDFRLRGGSDFESEIVSGELECTGCARIYPILQGIPRILPETEFGDNYCRNFQFYWLKLNWHAPQYNKQRFYQLTSWQPADLQDQFILDAGCGGGRWLYQFAEAGAKEIVAMDYTLAIDRAAQICSQFKNIHYIQADIFRMPLKDQLFDIVHCHGVLMATPDPKKGIEILACKTRSGGELAILLYRNLTRFQTFIDDAICMITRRLPTKLMFYLSLIPTLIEYIPGAVPLLENVIHLSGQPNFVLKHLHNFDWYTCAYRHRNSPNEVRRWLEDLKFPEIRILNTNDFRTRSRFEIVRRLKEYLLEHGFFLKATLGVRATKSEVSSVCEDALLTAYHCVVPMTNSTKIKNEVLHLGHPNSKSRFKTLVVLQPGYLPWLGFFEQMARSDIFVYYDDVQFDKHGWRNRNRIKSPNGPYWLTVPVRHGGFGKAAILDIEIDNRTPWARKHIGTIKQFYAGAPYLNRYLLELEDLLCRSWERLVDLDLAAAELMCKWLGLKHKIVRSSELGIKGEKSSRLVSFCKYFKADCYLSGDAAKNYLDQEIFASEGIQVEWQNYQHPSYPQLHGEFIPYLSTLDLLLNCGEKSLDILLGKTENTLLPRG